VHEFTFISSVTSYYNFKPITHEYPISKDFIDLDGNQKAMKPKKCCYMDRDCTPACVAYSAASELNESAKIMGMNGMNCMRLLLDLTELMERTNSDDFDEEDEDISFT
jgi:hypothetical protein